MDQPVLVHTEIDEGAELRHVADRAFQRHAGLQMLEVGHAFVEACDDKIGPWVAAGLFQLDQDVLDRDGTKARVGKGLGLERADDLAAAHELGHWALHGGQHPLHHRVGFRVHAGHVQRVVAIAYAQETGSLLEGLGPQARHFTQLLAIAERAVGVAPAHDARGHSRAQARHT